MSYDPGTSIVSDMDSDRRKVNGIIRTISGLYVDLFEPDINMINAQDIAHGLSHVNRFGGHTNEPYSVAEHSLYVSGQLFRMYKNEPLLALAGLFHDGSEAYLGDMIRPLKHMPEMHAFRAVEDKLEALIHEAFNTDTVCKDPRIKKIDNEILPWEMAMVRDSAVRIAPKPSDVRDAFLLQFEWLHNLWLDQLDAKERDERRQMDQRLREAASRSTRCYGA